MLQYVQKIWQLLKNTWLAEHGSQFFPRCKYAGESWQAALAVQNPTRNYQKNTKPLHKAVYGFKLPAKFVSLL
jgi:hypothetical protein